MMKLYGAKFKMDNIKKEEPDSEIKIEYNEKIEDNKEVEECCIEAWQDSYFEEPLNKIIIHGYSNTTFKSLSSVLHKIKGINEELAVEIKNALIH